MGRGNFVGEEFLGIFIKRRLKRFFGCGVGKGS